MDLEQLKLILEALKGVGEGALIFGVAWLAVKLLLPVLIAWLLASSARRIFQRWCESRERSATIAVESDRALNEAKALDVERHPAVVALREERDKWAALFDKAARHLGCNARGRVDGNQHVIDRAAYLSSMFTVDAYTATAKAEAERDAARADSAKLRAFVEWACDWFECEGFTHQPAAIEDCHGEKCRRPQCVACSGEHAYTSKEAQSDIGVQVETARAVIAASRAGET
jgi:hypothetical protein